VHRTSRRFSSNSFDGIKDNIFIICLWFRVKIRHFAVQNLLVISFTSKMMFFATFLLSSPTAIKKKLKRSFQPYATQGPKHAWWEGVACVACSWKLVLLQYERIFRCQQAKCYFTRNYIYQPFAATRLLPPATSKIFSLD